MPTHLPTQLFGIFVVLFLWMHALNTADAQPYELDQVVQAPFVSEVIHTGSANGVAWIATREGRQNIWYHDDSTGAPIRITPYDEDDGKPLSDLHRLEGVDKLTYTRGSPYNPTSDPGGPQQHIYTIDLQEREPRRVTQGSSITPAPDGRTILYSHQGQVYTREIGSDEDPDVLFQMRGGSHSHQWSPDGERLLFVSSRGSHSFIGIYHLEEDRIQWLSPDVYRDSNPVWSPEGDAVAFTRMPGAKHEERPFWRRNDSRFEIRVCQLEPESCDTVWKTDTGGGFAQSNPAQSLKWAAGNHLIFYSEHEGWNNLYTYSLDEEQMRPLATGSFEVEDLALTPDRRTAIFNANRGDINWRNLWSVPVSGGTARQLTETGTIDWSPVVSEDGNLAFISSDARHPGHVVTMDPGEPGSIEVIGQDLVQDDFPAGDLVEPSEVTFTAADGVEVHGQLFMPDNIRGESAPAIIYMHGGPVRQMYPAWHSRIYYHFNYAFNQYLASQGYVVLSVNFRSGIGYGADFRAAPDQGPRGASEYQDILAGADFLQQMDEVDPLRIGLWGGSYGGYLTALGLARDSDLFAAGVDLHGVHDWALRGIRRNGGGWGIFEDQMEEARRSSPVADLEFWTSPVLIVHADDDRNVDFFQTTDLVRRLEDIGKAQVETLVFPDDVHSFLLYDNWLTTFEESFDFFERHLH